MKCYWVAIVLLSQDSLLFPESLAAVTRAKLLQIKLHCLGVLAPRGTEFELCLWPLCLKSIFTVCRNVWDDNHQPYVWLFNLITFIVFVHLLKLSVFFRNRAWLKWKYRLQHPWLDLASLLEFPQRPWPAQDLWVCCPLSMAQAWLPHPPVLLLQADLGMPLCLPHHQVDQTGSGKIKGNFLFE